MSRAAELIESVIHEGPGLGIGDVVEISPKFKLPRISGYITSGPVLYGHVKGFRFAKGGVRNPTDQKFQFAGSKVDALIVTLPYVSYPDMTGGDGISIPRKFLTKRDRQWMSMIARKYYKDK